MRAAASARSPGRSASAPRRARGAAQEARRSRPDQDRCGWPRAHADRDARQAPRGGSVSPEEARLRAVESGPPGAHDAHADLENALFEVKRVIVGQEAMLERVIVALLTGGHVLLEGVPGLAKTLTVQTGER